MAALNGKGVRVELLNDEATRLRFDMNALVELEDRYGSLEAFEEALATTPFRAIRFALFIAGNWVGDPAIAPGTEKALGTLMAPVKLGYYSDRIGEALVEAIGLGEKEAPPDPPAAVGEATAGTPSPSSSPSPAVAG